MSRLLPGPILYPSRILTTRIRSRIREKYIRVGYVMTLYPAVFVSFSSLATIVALPHLPIIFHHTFN
jgi:hypothetical protein